MNAPATSGGVVAAHGPLVGCKVIEVGGIGPGPFAGMMLADLGAEVIRVDRPDGAGIDYDTHRFLLRGRRSVALNLKSSAGRQIVEDLAAGADMVIEGFRPGVMERLGLGPDRLLSRNPALVYGRMTGWGQDGPLSSSAGHDINYIATAGALRPVAGADGVPVPPLNMLGDFGGGAMLLVSGLLAALVHARASGQGQVVDAAIVDGTALLTAMLHSMREHQQWVDEPHSNLLDGGAPFYSVYPTADGEWLAVGAIEPQFYAELVKGLGLEAELGSVDRLDRSTWPMVRGLIAARIVERTRAEWSETFFGTDACVSPVLRPEEVIGHPHVAARATFIRSGGLQPAPAPRFSETSLVLPAPAPLLGQHTEEILRELGFARADVERLAADGITGTCRAAVVA